MTMLSLSDVSRDFITRGKTIQAMAGVSLDVSAGEFLTVVGPSGCGKSTLLNIVCGLLAPNIIRTLVYDPEVILMDEPSARSTPRRDCPCRINSLNLGDERG